MAKQQKWHRKPPNSIEDSLMTYGFRPRMETLNARDPSKQPASMVGDDFALTTPQDKCSFCLRPIGLDSAGGMAHHVLHLGVPAHERCVDEDAEA